MKHFPVESVFFESSTLRVESLSHGVKRLVLMRPERRNAFDEATIVDLSEAFTRLAAIGEREDCRLVILQGDGHMFCAGADLGYMKRQAEGGESGSFQDARALGRVFFKLALLPVPVIAAVRGAALGGGFGLVACADYCLADEDAIFGTPEVRIGLVPGVISPYIVRKVGLAHAQSFMLSGARKKAGECLASGLVSRVVATGESFEDALDAVVTTFLQAAPNAARRTKELIRKVSPLPGPEVFENAARQIAVARAADEAKEGLESFLGKSASEKTTVSWQRGLPKERL
ncbi:MAG: enoyl-CoA hydratase/isomerase family protein [Silvanigrellales bacterium]|jgi:methylglutaconyl-CoA hydratase|nr:enoyl-CoA hydratase/isomerase family protein [Silvanigrellales bacterium]